MNMYNNAFLYLLFNSLQILIYNMTIMFTSPLNIIINNFCYLVIVKSEVFKTVNEKKLDEINENKFNNTKPRLFLLGVE